VRKQDKTKDKAPSTVERPEDIVAEDDNAQDEATPDNAASPAEAIDQRISELEAEIEKNRQGWQRTLAEFQNYKRRIEREQESTQRIAAFDVITRLLPIIDDFERGMANIPDNLEGEPWLNGIELIQGKFNKLLNEYDVETIDPQGEAFDPTHHQAITMDDSDEVESGHVIETLQKGYISGEHILRPALVRVAN
jgi:molecular chaperone GrpE